MFIVLIIKLCKYFHQTYTVRDISYFVNLRLCIISFHYKIFFLYYSMVLTTSINFCIHKKEMNKYNISTIKKKFVMTYDIKTCLFLIVFKMKFNYSCQYC